MSLIRLIAYCQNDIQKLDYTLNQCGVTEVPQNLTSKLQVFSRESFCILLGRGPFKHLKKL